MKMAFPRFANYNIPINILIRRAFDAEPVMPPALTKRTLETGARHAPDLACAPFKFNLGSYIEALDAGADTLIQIGGPCRLSYYGELHEQILRDLGYEFKFINLANMNMNNPISVYSELKKFNSKMTVRKLLSALLFIVEMVKEMDYLEKFTRENVGFEVVRGSFDALYKEYLEKAEAAKNRKELKEVYKEYKEKIESVPVDKPEKPLRVGVVGEFYTVMEPYTNHFIEREMARKGVQVTRNLNITNSVFTPNQKPILKSIARYAKYDIGATGVATVHNALKFAESGYDGLIHVKSFGCTPEIDAMPILQNIAADFKMPILFLSFDSQTGEAGVHTRLEAFYDMLTGRADLQSGADGQAAGAAEKEKV